LCDEFLDVKWIDEDRYIGKLKTEWYKNGQKQGILYLLVKLEEPGSEEMFRRGDGIFYGISEQEYYSKEFENFIKEAKLSYGKGFFFMYASKREKKKEFYQKAIPVGTPSKNYTKSFSDFSKTICVLYPKEEYVFIFETKKPFLKDNLSKDLKEKYYLIKTYAEKEIKKFNAQGAQIEYINSCDAIDVNFDGFDDYIFSYNVGDVPLNKRVVIYFSKDRKYAFKDITRCIPGMNVYYKKLGENQVFFGRCNLSELIKGGN